MKQYITLEETKMQIPGFVDYGEQDEYITGCILDAQAALETRLQSPLSEYEDEQGCIPRDLRRSILITISDFYDNRSDIVFSKPYSIGRAAALSAPFIKFRGAEEDGTT